MSILRLQKQATMYIPKIKYNSFIIRYVSDYAFNILFQKALNYIKNSLFEMAYADPNISFPFKLYFVLCPSTEILQ